MPTLTPTQSEGDLKTPVREAVSIHRISMSIRVRNVGSFEVLESIFVLPARPDAMRAVPTRWTPRIRGVRAFQQTPLTPRTLRRFVLPPFLTESQTEKSTS